MIRVFDIIFSSICLIILLPFLFLISIIIILNSKGPILYVQKRVGRYNKDFSVLKFRSMRVNSDKLGLLTIGGRDPRITSVGYILRKYKLDELPQLFNVLKGEMSLVGPRPEVRKYVNLYSKEQLQILNVRPGITDIASIKYSNENIILEKVDEPEKFYIEHIMADKICLNIEFIKNPSILKYFSIIINTIFIKRNHSI